MAGISSPPRCRAKRACRRCNLRRVKCNVMESQPCDNCDRANAKCEVLASRRGKHLQTRLSRPKSDSENGRTDADYETRQSETDRPGDRIDSPSVNHDSNGSAYCMSEISNAQARDDTEQLFLGESATLRCVYDTAAHSGDDGSPDKNTLLQFPLPQKLPSETILSDWEAQRRERRIGYLRADGIFDMPLPSVCERLFAAYFKWFHPCFPIIEPADLLAKYNAKTLSPLLSLAIYSLAAAHCDDEILAEASFVSRYQAQYTFYSKAKDLYEADYEADKTTIIQALFLMSFWRSGRLLDKHTRYWLGMALTLAQSSAMHRALPNTQPNQAKIRRRIWWCIYMREFQCSASLGLPTRIRDCDCDIEPLQPEDLYDDRPCESTRLQWTLPPQTPAQVSYAIEMSKLAKLVGRIVDAEYVPHRMTTVTRQQLKADLLEWECQLPEHMRSHVRLGGRLDFYAAMLHIVYNNLLILLSRNSYIRNDADGDIALQAACTNSSFIGDLLTRNLVPHADGYLISCLFNTLCIHVIHLRRSRDTARTVAEQRARFCVLALKELQERWKVTVCLLQLRLFFQALDHSTAKRLQGDAGENLPADDSTGTFMDVLPPATSVLPELWDLHYSGPGWGDQSHLPCLDSTHGADVSGLFQWPFATDGVGELLGHTTNLSP